ncbi:hypothetical protein EV182_004210 [Spiromyces aspiralis]|uniref:Uncharacterized protein n=1 Tax=Spiromyces aspiralis TaxID=68401 RepID=A0ACC1HFG2_9FUNG|nr:hypothetical protein EV182_004210 [Spiromyces aspiralis]
MSRGRGRGRGSKAPLSALQTELLGIALFSKKLTEDYPEFELPTHQAPSEAEKEVVLLVDELERDMRNTPFYLKDQVMSYDIERYSDRYLSASTGRDAQSSKTLRSIKTSE